MPFKYLKGYRITRDSFYTYYVKYSYMKMEDVFFKISVNEYIFHFHEWIDKIISRQNVQLTCHGFAYDISIRD